MEALTSQLGGLTVTSKPPLSPLVYLVGKKGRDACFFHCSSDKFFLSQCLPTTGNFEVGKLYDCCMNSSGETILEELSECSHRFYYSRLDNHFTTYGYAKYVLPSLLLGSRLRDFDQNCAKVVSCAPLTIKMSARQGRLDEAKFLTETGELLHVRVDNVDRCSNEETKAKMTLFCTPLRTPLCGVVKNARMEFSEKNAYIPFVTTALEGFYKSDRTNIGRTLLDRIYGVYGSISHTMIDQSLITVVKGGKVISLNAEQSEAVRRYQSDCPGFVVESPPGSGKTMTAAAMAVSYTGPGLQLFLSTANVPVFNMASALAEFDYGDQKIGHITAKKREPAQQEAERSPFSIFNLEQFRQLTAQLAHAGKREKYEIRKQMSIAYDAIIATIPAYDVMFGTIDLILGKLLKKRDPEKPKRRCPIQEQLETRVSRIVIDEASQMTEAALNALILCFPLAQIVLIGDSNQLPPFMFVKGEHASELAACSALEVMKRKRNVPVITLRTVYRAAPSMMKHYSDVFYDGKLVSGKPESNRVQLSSICGGVVQRAMFVNILASKATHTKTGTSLINDVEIRALELMVIRLRNEGYGPESVMIIAYYEAQRKLATTRIPEEYEVLTVDSAQGREKDIVIVLTTRDSTNASAFFTCPLRCNVAVSRHKEALIILGHGALLEIEPWKQILDKKYFSTVTYGPV